MAAATNQLVQDVATYPVPDAALLCPAGYADLLATVAEAASTGAADPGAWDALRLMYRTVYESRTRRCPCARCARARQAASRRLERIRAEHQAAAARALRRSSTPRSTMSTTSGRSDA